RKGLPFKSYTVFQRESRLDRAAVGRVLRVPERTLARRKAEGVFKPDESERLLRLSRVYEAALDLFEGDRDAAKRWLESPARALGGQTPLEAAETEIGAREVDHLIGRLEHGVFP
ncbi:MAG TPA: antitoxin Xre/MbcA/ParS toxin-binding domain-containing protein, partial [Planctomycetaceae bacterium]